MMMVMMILMLKVSVALSKGDIEICDVNTWSYDVPKNFHSLIGRRDAK
jgi:hypothetical protein